MVGFSFPYTTKPNIPLEEDGQKLTFGFVEVGCKAKRKPSQLHHKRHLLRDWWANKYRDAHGILWVPEVYRIMAHFQGDPRGIHGGSDYTPNFEFVYTDIPDEALGQLDQRSRSRIFEKCPDRYAEGLERILEERDGEKMLDLIHNTGDPRLCFVRSRVAEIMVQDDIHRNCTLMQHRNGEIRAMNERYDNGTEVDMVLLGYGFSGFNELVENIMELDHIDVYLGNNPKMVF